MDKQKLAKAVVLISYMTGAFGVPTYLYFQYVSWIFSFGDKLLFILNTVPLGILLGFWFWISLGIFGYSMGEEEFSEKAAEE
jgi:hypothetical protein